MPSYYSQQPYEPEVEHKPRPRIPASVFLSIPVSIMFAAGILYAAKFGHERATEELEARPNPSEANETMSAPFRFDPGDEPLILAGEQKALRDHLSAPPGSVGSGTLVESSPLRLRVVARDLDLLRVMVIEGRLEGQQFWTKADRLQDAMEKNGGN